MGKIRKSAYLKICKDCGGHACIVFANGTESPDFGSKQTGKIEIDFAFEENTLSSEERDFLENQLALSALPSNRNIIDDLLEEIQDENDLNEELEMLEELIHNSRPPLDQIRNN